MNETLFFDKMAKVFGSRPDDFEELSHWIDRHSDAAKNWFDLCRQREKSQYAQGVDQFVADLESTLMRNRFEGQLTVASAIGALELVKYDLIKESHEEA